MGYAVPPLVEPVAIQETYIDGIARIEQVGPNLKLDFYSLRRLPEGEEHGWQREIVLKIVMSAQAVAAAAMLATAAADTAVHIEPTH